LFAIALLFIKFVAAVFAMIGVNGHFSIFSKVYYLDEQPEIIALAASLGKQAANSLLRVEASLGLLSPVGRHGAFRQGQ
jgi:hypothetical protein